MTETQAARIVGKFGGRTAMVRDTPYTVAQVRHAEKIGVFPAGDMQQLIDLAADLGHEITPYDFIAHLVPTRVRVIESAA